MPRWLKMFLLNHKTVHRKSKFSLLWSKNFILTLLSFIRDQETEGEEDEEEDEESDTEEAKNVKSEENRRNSPEREMFFDDKTIKTDGTGELKCFEKEEKFS